jgi:type II secretory pathway component PulJ
MKTPFHAAADCTARQNRVTTPVRRAFTLLEVLLALTLAVLLLGAIFTAMEQSWKLTASGREEMERSQLARALLRRFAIDVRSIAYVPPVVTDSDAAESGSASLASSGSSSSSGSGSTDESTSPPADTEEEPSARSIGIRGTLQWVEMHISRPRRDLEFAADVDGNKVQSRTSDMRVVTYQLAAPGPDSGSQGLIRTEGDRLASQLVEEKGGVSTSLSAQLPLAPEVEFVQFRYFDGLAWFETWDSEEAGRLPRAVEITLGFAPSKTRPGPALSVSVSGSVNQVRSVVLIPIADPLPEEFAP